jgi:hypothetical protein
MSSSWQAGNQAWSSCRPSTKGGLLLPPRTHSTGQVMAAACSGPKVHVTLPRGPGRACSSARGWPSAPTCGAASLACRPGGLGQEEESGVASVGSQAQEPSSGGSTPPLGDR